MFCPKCAAQNVDDAKFCRACGADIRLVPHALTGRLGRRDDDDDDDDELVAAADKYSYERGVRKLVSGVIYLLAFTVMVVFFRQFWWMTFWFIFPAIGKISSGAGILAHARQESRRLGGGSAGMTTLPRANATQSLPNFRLNEVAPADTAEIVAPPRSVTEGTTRHLGAVEPVAREDGARSS
ncbi:MAG: zinc ribbon domain-containing protein [Pyrinomonadaceae bacterium]